ncbi:BEL1-like homeodomain protein 7 [Cicer arietinum]|uniref:BEL1-like homeodomain protein 8 n=1 Tax=Cicer arietinum TaxID=3827 RepID=A0A1S2YKJ2_CICAR|nr:BEL1-like homeodomain protein 8 [Cicer arietinum]XP_004506044.1 BEL1-like homeodomain protein 8 [Cicer arietinum]XP_027191359.1 BEL1-like homeodomain protein 8 [Cicer arietinum]
MSSLRPELHVAQQIRRDKLRFQNHFQDNNMEQLLSLHQVAQPGFNLDLLQLRNNNNNMVVDDDDDDDDEAQIYSSQMINSFSTSPQYASFHHSSSKQQQSHQISDNWTINSSSYNYHPNETNFLPSHLHNHSNSNSSLQDIATSSITPHSLMQHSIWGGVNSHNATITTMSPFHENQANLWTNRGVVENMGTFLSDCNPHQGLSLSLSSQSKLPSPSSFEQGSSNMMKTLIHQEPIIIGTTTSNSSNSSYRSVGPLGPFTGYATILKSSRFLKPCQELLEECCGCRQSGPKWVSRDVVVDDENGVCGSNSGSMLLYGSKEKENSVADADAGNSFCLSSSSSRPECQKNKAQLLFMQQEVSRRHKQYHQQMQMVVSSFESVAGLSSATPYISLALKSLSKHFKSLKNSITDQLKITCQVLGEDFSILPPTITSSSSKIDSSNNVTRIRCMNHSIQKNYSGGNSNVDFVEPQQHVWRPQRGLPERSVAILKAWLFEHFLHPYPTDTDKHMLATQTGLSRNQVSNWFINARVRVWKPMVEEIHMLESKGITESENNSTKNEASRGVGRNGMAEKEFQCMEMGSSSSTGINNVENDKEQWNNIKEKRSKLENEITENMDTTTVMGGFMPYQRGSVSLTLGLRHGVENVQQQLQHEVELRHQFGGHMIHDFVG